ncbi:hypothetical protein ABT160_02565 [Streptomyces sp. NPDC001941]|uniref:hypothetical protein n=1 Tax=Streptomyces sp. NPDC001941 TaxID=3154659 RepID=UPI003322B206
MTTARRCRPTAVCGYPEDCQAYEWDDWCPCDDEDGEYEPYEAGDFDDEPYEEPAPGRPVEDVLISIDQYNPEGS